MIRHPAARRVAGLLAVLSAAIVAAPAGSAAAEGGLGTLTRYRGTVETRANDTLVLRTGTGDSVTAYMNPKTRVLLANRSVVRDIKPESYISVLTTPGEAVAGAVIYSPSERGFEAGRQPWDARPGATLTAGWIAERDGRDPVRVRLAFPNGEARFTLPAATPTTQIAPGEKALLVPDATVVVFTRTDASGLLNADTVVVGREGARPAL